MITFKPAGAHSSHFTRRQEGDRTIFTVTPATWPGGVGGCFVIVGALVLIPSLIFVPMPANFLLLLIGGGIGYLGWRAVQNDKKINDARKPFEVVVTPDAVTANGHTIQRSDIVEFVYDGAGGGGQSYSEVRVGGSSLNTARTGAAVGREVRQQIEAARAQVSYWVGVRAKSDSRAIKLAENLSQETAGALLRDLVAIP